MRGRYVALGAQPVRCVGNLKYAGKPLPVEPEELKALKDRIGQRPVWLMAQSHRGEEQIAVDAHKMLRDKFPNILTLIVPRHPVRSDEIVGLIEAANLHVGRRSAKELIAPSTDIYLADTLGELGLFYALSRIAVVGGSFAPMGCHNLIEPAQQGCAIVFGPSIFNCSEIAKEFIGRQAALQLQGSNEINFTLQRLLSEPDAAQLYAHNARALAGEKNHVLTDGAESLVAMAGVYRAWRRCSACFGRAARRANMKAPAILVSTARADGGGAVAVVFALSIRRLSAPRPCPTLPSQDTGDLRRQSDGRWGR